MQCVWYYDSCGMRGYRGGKRPVCFYSVSKFYLPHAWVVEVRDYTSLSCAFVAITITNGPQDTTVCTNHLANCTCGFVGVDPNFVVPDWRIIKRNSSGVVVSNKIISGTEIIKDTTDGLEWMPDLVNPNNGALRVGPVDGTDNQSSYHCAFTTLLRGTVVSSVGTLTVISEICVLLIAYYVESICCLNPNKISVSSFVKQWNHKILQILYTLIE